MFPNLFFYHSTFLICKKSHGTPLSIKKKIERGNVFLSSIIKHGVIRVRILALYMSRHLHLISENHTQMELMRILSDEICVLLIIRMAASEGSKLIASRLY